MTFKEMHDLLDNLMDKSDLPWFDDKEKDQIFNMAQMEFVKERYRQFETTEKRRQDLATIVRSGRFGNGSATISPSFMMSQLGDPLFLLRMVGYFDDPCKKDSAKLPNMKHDTQYSGELEKIDTFGFISSKHLFTPTARQNIVEKNEVTLSDVVRKSIKPVQIDDLESHFGDPFNEPDNNHPIYVVRADYVGHRYIQIFSTTDPKMIDVDFLITPDKIDVENKPNSSPGLPEHTHEEIVNIALRKALDIVESPRYGNQPREILEQEN